jgi:multiple sugar transport system permease protein
MVQFKNFDFFGINWLIGKITGGPTSMNILNTRFVFYVPSLLGMGLKSGLFIYVYNQFFRGLPKELEDSALIDGCGAFRTFTSIMMPNAKPVLLTVLLFSIVWHWNDFFYSSMYLDQQPTVATALAGLSQSLGKIRGLNIYDPYELVTRMQAGSLIAILPLLLMYIFLQKYFTESIERTGIVG